MSIDKGQAKDLIDDFLYFAERTEEAEMCAYDFGPEGVVGGLFYEPLDRPRLEQIRDRFIEQEVGG